MRASSLLALCSIAGVAQTRAELDGEDISGIWFGADRERTKPVFWKTSATGSKPAMRDGKWKLHLPRKQRGTPELYDLSVDPSESNNVANANPEQLKRLTQQLRRWNAELPADYEKAGKRDKDD